MWPQTRISMKCLSWSNQREDLPDNSSNQFFNQTWSTLESQSLGLQSSLNLIISSHLRSRTRIQPYKCLQIQSLSKHQKSLYLLVWHPQARSWWLNQIKRRRETGFLIQSICIWEEWHRDAIRWRNCSNRLDKSSVQRSTEGSHTLSNELHW